MFAKGGELTGKCSQARELTGKCSLRGADGRVFAKGAGGQADGRVRKGS